MTSTTFQPTPTEADNAAETLAGIRDSATRAWDANDEMMMRVFEARTANYGANPVTWEAIAQAMGTSRQNAQQKLDRWINKRGI